MGPELQILIFLGIVLKIPVAFACWLIWWAIRAEADPAEAEDEDGHGFRRFRRQPKRPRGPRRGPHAPDALPLPCPELGGLRVVRRAPAPDRALAGAAAHERRR